MPPDLDDFQLPADDARPLPRRWPPALGVAAAVAALHAAVIGWLPVGLGEGWQGGAARPVLTVRQLREEPPAAPVPPPAPAPVPAPPPPAVVAAAPAAEPVPVPEPPPPAASAPDTPPPVAVEAPVVAVAASAAPAPADPPAAAAEVAAAADAADAAPRPADGGGTAPPVYATRLPPPAQLRYELRRGAISGDADFQWRSANGRYEMAIEGRVMTISALLWQSEGAIDSAGLAPDRFTDRRGRRAPLAANFQRSAGKISYSGPTVEYPLVAGAQDRLSWMVQLAAIVGADPARFTRPDAAIVMFVTGARGDGDLWSFETQGSEAIELPAGRVDAALRLRRLPRKPYDTQAEVWLDPARDWLPVRVRLTVPQTDETTEFRLLEPRRP